MAVQPPSEAYTIHTDEGDTFICVAMVHVSLNDRPYSERDAFSAELRAWAANHAIGLFASQRVVFSVTPRYGWFERFWFAVKEDAIHFDLVWS